jgi:ribokinase
VAFVREARVVLLQLEISTDTVIAAARWATGLVVLNPAPARPLPAELLAVVDVFVPNEFELARLVGAQPGPQSLREVVTRARTLSPDREVVVTWGRAEPLSSDPSELGMWPRQR